MKTFSKIGTYLACQFCKRQRDKAWGGGVLLPYSNSNLFLGRIRLPYSTQNKKIKYNYGFGGAKFSNPKLEVATKTKNWQPIFFPWTTKFGSIE
jgi:hypothetical protein